MTIAIGKGTFATDPAFRPSLVDQQVAGGVEHTGVDHKGIAASADIAFAADVGNPTGMKFIDL